jgi:Integrase core domain
VEGARDCRRYPDRPQGSQIDSAFHRGGGSHRRFPADCFYALQPTIPHLTRSSLPPAPRHQPEVEGSRQLVRKTGRTSASAFLEVLIAAVPYKIQTVLTDNGIQFTFPPRYAGGPTARYVTHMSDMRCQENGIEHRLTKIKHPWTNGQVERMNRTIKEATVQRYHYDRHDQFELTLPTSSMPTTTLGG